MRFLQKNKLILISSIVIAMFGCTNQHPTYDQYQFNDIGFCQGLDAQGEPINLSRTISLKSPTISSTQLCIQVETDDKFFFAVTWYTPGEYFNLMTLEAVQSGWVSTPLDTRPIPDENMTRPMIILPGEHNFRIAIARVIKQTETLYVVE